MKKLLLISTCLMSFTLFSFVSAYSEEQVNAYEYAYNKGITTINNINKANLNGGITRIEMAKMMSNYAINILWLKPDTNLRCFFYDVDPSINAQYDNWITKICQLWLMGILDDWSISDYFNPFDTVTRGQRVTIFSRALNKSRGEDIIEWDPFYKPHLKNLSKKGLIQNVKTPSPTSVEKRWNVLIMMYRTDPNNTITVDYATGKTKLKAGQIYRNSYYWFEILSSRKHTRIVDIDTWWFISLCNFIEKQYENLTLYKSYEEEFKETAQNFWENDLIICRYWAYNIVKKWWPNDIDLEKEGWYLDSPLNKIDLNNWNIILEYPQRWRWQEAQYEYERGKYKELLEIQDLGMKFLGIDKKLYEYSDKLYNNILSIEWTSSMNIYDDFKLQPLQNNDKLYQILNQEKVDLSKNRDFLDNAYKQMTSTKNKLKNRKRQFFIENPDFKVNSNLTSFKKEIKKMINENYSSSPIEKLTAIKFFKDEFGIYLINDMKDDNNYANDPKLDELINEVIKQLDTN